MQRLPPKVVSCPSQDQGQHPSGKSAKSLTLKWEVLSRAESLCSDQSTPGGRNPAGLPWACLTPHVPLVCKAEHSQFTQKRTKRQAALLRGVREVRPQGVRDTRGTGTEEEHALWHQAGGPRGAATLHLSPLHSGPLCSCRVPGPFCHRAHHAVPICTGLASPPSIPLLSISLSLTATQERGGHSRYSCQSSQRS